MLSLQKPLPNDVRLILSLARAIEQSYQFGFEQHFKILAVCIRKKIDNTSRSRPVSILAPRLRLEYGHSDYQFATTPPDYPNTRLPYEKKDYTPKHVTL